MASDPIVYIIDDDDSVRESLEFLIDCAGLRARSFVSADAFLGASPSSTVRVSSPMSECLEQMALNCSTRFGSAMVKFPSS